MDWAAVGHAILTAPATADITGLIIVIGLLCWIIYMQIKNGQEVATVSNNHLSGLPDMQEDIQKLVILTEQQNRLLAKMNDDVVYIRARTNGWNGR